MNRRPPARLAFACALLLASAASAAPDLPEDDPDWILLRDARDSGALPDFLGGVQILGEDEVQKLLQQLAREQADPLGKDAWLPNDPRLLPLSQSGFWFRPAQRITLRAAAADVQDRPYSLPALPRQLYGFVDLSCEYQDGRPCGPGVGTGLELDSSAGYGTWLSASTRLRAELGTHGYGPDLAIDRAVLKARLGPLVVEAGRDAFAIGPSFRAARMLSHEDAPADGVRVFLRPVSLPFDDPDTLRVSLLYLIYRLRDPQTFESTLLDCSRMQLNLFRRVELGGSRILQFGGDGAPSLSFADFVALHFTRKYGDGVTKYSNNRLSFDASVLVPELFASRVYYEVAFDDTRRQLLDSFRHDTDQVLGVEIRRLPFEIWRRVLIEAELTGRTSQTDVQWVTGVTNAGRTLGSPLGPDTIAITARADLALPLDVTLTPWAGLVTLFDNTYITYDTGPVGVSVLTRGPAEHRQRAGLDGHVRLRPEVFLQVSLFAERVDTFEYVPGATRFNSGISAALSYTPAF